MKNGVYDDEWGKRDNIKNIWPNIFWLGYTDSAQQGMKTFYYQEKVVKNPRSLKNWLDYDILFPVLMKVEENRITTSQSTDGEGTQVVCRLLFS